MSSTGGAARLRPNPGAGVLLGEADGRESGESCGHGKAGTGTSGGVGSFAPGEMTAWRMVKMVSILLGVVVLVGGRLRLISGGRGRRSAKRHDKNSKLRGSTAARNSYCQG